jgi:TetR/AcrR family tetracycline transcriptional repressor
MALSRATIVEAAYVMLCEHGLAGLSMRRLAQDLGVQAGALYYHVASKQDLLAAVAERILSDSAPAISATDPGQKARDIREALLPVRDSADVISFAQAFRPDSLVPLRELEQLFSKQFPKQQARWASQTLVHYILGFVAEEQNHAELVRAEILGHELGHEESRDAFGFGVDAIIQGLATMRARGTSNTQSKEAEDRD